MLKSLAAIVALSIPILAIVTSYLRRTKAERIRALELQKEIAETELRKEEMRARAMEAENKKYDQIIAGTRPPDDQ